MKAADIENKINKICRLSLMGEAERKLWAADIIETVFDFEKEAETENRESYIAFAGKGIRSLMKKLLSECCNFSEDFPGIYIIKLDDVVYSVDFNDEKNIAVRKEVFHQHPTTKNFI